MIIITSQEIDGLYLLFKLKVIDLLKLTNNGIYIYQTDCMVCKEAEIKNVDSYRVTQDRMSDTAFRDFCL